MAISTVLLGRLGDRRGHRAGVIVGAAMQVATLLVVLFSRGLASCVAAYAGAGLCAASGYVSHTNMLFETCPHDHRQAHITAANLVLSLPLLLAPVAAGVFAQRFGPRALFGACLVFSAAATAWFALAVREPRVVDAFVREKTPAG